MTTMTPLSDRLLQATAFNPDIATLYSRGLYEIQDELAEAFANPDLWKDEEECEFLWKHILLEGASALLEENARAIAALEYKAYTAEESTIAESLMGLVKQLKVERKLLISYTVQYRFQR